MSVKSDYVTRIRKNQSLKNTVICGYRRLIHHQKNLENQMKQNFLTLLNDHYVGKEIIRLRN